MMEDENLVEEIIDDPVEDPVEDPVVDPTEDLVEDPVEVPASGETGTETAPEEEVIENEIPEEDDLEVLSSGEEDLTGYRTIYLTQLDLLEGEQSGDVPSVMVEVIESVLGEYQRMTYTVEAYDADGQLIGTSTEYVPGLAGLDYAWITGAILFGLFIGGIFKLLGGLIRS